LRKTTIIDSLRLSGIILLVKQLLATSARSFIITKITTLSILFGMLSSPKAFLFKRLLINLLISSTEIIGLILSALWFIIASISILLMSAVPVLNVNIINIILINRW